MPSLRIGNLEINPPIIQGGMGIRVSRANLAAAVANEGCAGVIAGTGLGRFEDFPNAKFAEVNNLALRAEVRKARSKTQGILGVNLLVALTDYESLVKTAAEENVDLLISGAGLPLQLPAYVGSKDIKLIPIVSSVRTLNILCKRWKLHHNRLPDAVIVEGIKAGGHLGYTFEDAISGTDELEKNVQEIIAYANTFSPSIPVIVAGGVWGGADIAHFLRLGASGVQMATRFVCTQECDVHPNFKKAYLDARPEDMTIIKSPVGLPGRVITNAFVEKIKQGHTVPFKCKYHCLKTCDPNTSPYCIAEVLAKAAEGKLDESFAFAGSNASRCTEIVSVKVLVEQLKAEYSASCDGQLAEPAASR
ncbi:MAG: nitronate monooxygenase [Sedimentisphaerales bacterium]|nr:nitronate monooxygenase [Sedimentisphaerales bacterium]